MLNTAIVANQPTFPMNFSEERKPYKTDPFTLIDGRYVGHDGFVVPKDFDEFHQRFPHHIPNWVKRHTDRLALREDLEDWTQDLTNNPPEISAAQVQAPGGRQGGYRSNIRSCEAPRCESGPILELHQLMPREQVQNHSFQTQKGRDVPHG